MRRLAPAAIALTLFAACAGGDYDVKVDLENLSGEDKTDWPVVLRVCHVLGRNLAPGSIHPKGFHVFGPDGKELAHDVEAVPPYDWPGNDELIFLVPSMKKGEVVTVRITNTPKPSPARRRLDVVHNPHNLIRNGGFEAGGAGGAVAGWSGQARRDAKVKRSGKSSMLLEGTGRQRAAYAAPVALHKGSRYYAGVWCRTANVARYGVAAGRGGYFNVTGFEKVWGRAPTLRPQCYTREWNKSRFFARYGLEYTGWGVDRGHVLAAAEKATVQIALDQKMQWCMTKPHGKWWLDDFVLLAQPKVTVRFAEALAPLVTGGVFLFTRPTNTPMGGEPSKKFPKPWAAFPFPHEAVKSIDRWGLKGQRVPYLVGLYHTGPLEKVSCTVPGGGVAGAGGKVPVEFLEFSHGYLNGPHHYLADHEKPVDFAGPVGIRYFLATFGIPRDAKAGRYTGKLVLASAGGKLAEVPITLRVQEMEQHVLKDRYIGMIMQASPVRYNADTLAVYARSGFSCVTIFGGFLKYAGAREKRDIDLEHLGKQMSLAKKHGLSAVCLYSDLQLDQKPRGPGPMHRSAMREADAALKAGAKEPREELVKKAYFRLLKQLDGECRKHPDWPILIHMNWDEPGGAHPRMGWTNECLPDALTTLDAGFRALPRVLKHYNMPALDDPCDFNGPELYAALKAKGKRFGLAASHKQGEPARYQPGIWIATSGASYMHAWHLAGAGLMKVIDKKALRSVSLAAAGEGMDDLKTYALLAGEIAKGLRSPDPKAKAAATEARAYLKKVFSVFNGDGAHASGNPPHLGWVCTWGYEGFYDDWSEQMARHAAAIRSVQWID